VLASLPSVGRREKIRKRRSQRTLGTRALARDLQGRLKRQILQRAVVEDPAAKRSSIVGTPLAAAVAFRIS